MRRWPGVGRLPAQVWGGGLPFVPLPLPSRCRGIGTPPSLPGLAPPRKPPEPAGPGRAGLAPRGSRRRKASGGSRPPASARRRWARRPPFVEDDRRDSRSAAQPGRAPSGPAVAGRPRSLPPRGSGAPSRRSGGGFLMMKQAAGATGPRGRRWEGRCGPHLSLPLSIPPSAQNGAAPAPPPAPDNGRGPQGRCPDRRPAARSPSVPRALPGRSPGSAGGLASSPYLAAGRGPLLRGRPRRAPSRRRRKNDRGGGGRRRGWLSAGSAAPARRRSGASSAPAGRAAKTGDGSGVGYHGWTALGGAWWGWPSPPPQPHNKRGTERAWRLPLRSQSASPAFCLGAPPGAEPRLAWTPAWFLWVSAGEAARYRGGGGRQASPAPQPRSGRRLGAPIGRPARRPALNWT